MARGLRPPERHGHNVERAQRLWNAHAFDLAPVRLTQRTHVTRNHDGTACTPMCATKSEHITGACSCLPCTPGLAQDSRMTGHSTAARPMSHLAFRAPAPARRPRRIKRGRGTFLSPASRITRLAPAALAPHGSIARSVPLHPMPPPPRKPLCRQSQDCATGITLAAAHRRQSTSERGRHRNRRAGQAPGKGPNGARTRQHCDRLWRRKPTF
jgi:hypothetical protein